MGNFSFANCICPDVILLLAAMLVAKALLKAAHSSSVQRLFINLFFARKI